MTGRGRDRPHGEERERRTGWDVAPSSRHLWVGNLSPRVTQNLLSEQFLRFGDLDSIAHVAGRSYAFVNFIKDEDAAVALRSLQGFNVAGAPLRIEFAKPERDQKSSHDERYPAYNEGRHSIERGESHLRRDSRLQRTGPERSYDNTRGNKDSEPSEMLWVGFPAFLDVDDEALRRAFSPFGEIDKITTFPGRSYAFVRYRSVVAACRAKEALQGKLFNNPRVSICFAKSDLGPAEHGRSSTSTSFPPHFKPDLHHGLSGQGSQPFQRERSFDRPIGEFHMASPRFLPSVDRMMPGEPNIRGFGRNSSFDRGRVHDEGPDRRTAENSYEHHRMSPALERDAQWHGPHFEKPWRVPHLEDSRRVDDDSHFPSAKKMKTDSFPDKELPEYPFSDAEQERHDTGPPKLFRGFPEPPLHAYNKNYDSVPFAYKGVPDNSRSSTRVHAESTDPWRASDGFKPGSGHLSLKPIKLEKISPEPHPPSLKEEWKWEGTIAKGGTPVCRARCFPVGKVLDFMLPELLNCTARTDLEMLAKHYYQAASSWVVFFVPETDADIAFYNEFMHYLGDKQRAAVAKLDEKITLFLVPPSEFSEQVLKVPGKMSISGVILKFQQPTSNFNSLNHPPEPMADKLPPVGQPPDGGVGFREDTSFRRPSPPDLNSSSGLVAPPISNFLPPDYPRDYLPYSTPALPLDNVTDFHGESRQNLPSNWPVHMHPNSSTGSLPPVAANSASHSFNNPMVEEYQYANSKVPHGRTLTNNASEASGVSIAAHKFPPQQDAKPQVPSSLPMSLQPDQLAQLAVLLGQHKQLGKEALLAKDGGQPNLLQNPSLPSQVSVTQFSPMHQLQQYSSIISTDHSSHAPQMHQPPSVATVQVSQAQHVPHQSSSSSTVQPVRNAGQQSNQQAPQVSATQFSPMHQFQQYSSSVPSDHFSHPPQMHQQPSVATVLVSQSQHVPCQPSSSSTVQPVGKPGLQNNQQAPNSTREEAEADPQKRLQATLQLAAALLQQIQQQAKN